MSNDDMPTTGYLSMADGLTEIRRQLLWDQIRTINTNMPENMFQEMKALPIDAWIQTWFDAFEGSVSKDDLAAVHEMLWPTTH